MKKLAKLSRSSCCQTSCGWRWHWAHSRRRPRKACATCKRRRDARRGAALPVQVERLALLVQLQVLAARARSPPPSATTSAAQASTVAAVAAGGGQDALDELVVGHVLLQAGADPLLEARRVHLLANAVGVDAEVAGLEQVAELQRPQGGVAGPGQQFVDLLRPLVRVACRRGRRGPPRASAVRRSRRGVTRRRKVASSARSAGGMFSRRSLARTCRSMKLCGLTVGEGVGRRPRHQQTGQRRLGAEADDRAPRRRRRGP